MKASDIEPLIGYTGQTYDVSLKYLNESVAKWVKTDGLELCPDFQRGHVWTLDQQVSFVEYILRGGTTTPLLLNHPGWMTSFKGDFVVVDGLQRLTALTMFLSDKLAVFNGHYRMHIEGIEQLLRSKYMGIRIASLQSETEVLRWYLELNSAGTQHTADELDRVRRLLRQKELRA